MHRVAAMVVVALLSGGPVVAQTTPPAIPVGVVPAVLQPVTRAAAYVGRIEAQNRVDITARVTGYLEAVLFKEGATVAEGAPLFRIEQPPFEAAVQQAQGALLQAQATLANATLQRQRADELVKTNSVPVAERDTRAAAEKNAQGAVIRAEADLKTAQINLSYTEITAPITGRIGRAAVTQGNVVGPNSGSLATIVSIDPMYATFPVSQRDFLGLQHEKERMKADAVLVKLSFADGSAFPQVGRIDFVDTTVDRATDTVIVRAVVPNPDGVLVDGQFVNISVQGDKPDEKIVVPQAALIADQAGNYVFIVENGTAMVKRVKLGGEVGPHVVVAQGLEPGAQVIVEGVQSVRPGAPVTASPVRTAMPGG